MFDDAENRAGGAVASQATRAPWAMAAGEIDFAGDAAANPLGLAGARFVNGHHLSDEFVAGRAGESVVAALQLEVGRADAGGQQADAREAFGDARKRGAAQFHAAGFEMDGKHGPFSQRRADAQGNPVGLQLKHMASELHLERQHAIVLGGSVAGLLAARALSPHFSRVTVVEKDRLPSFPPAPRDGVPQGKHVHVLLPGGVAALDRLFPGRVAELVEHGAQPFDYGQSQFYMIGKWMPRIQTELHTLSQSRPFLEGHIRRWVGELPNVAIIDEAHASALLWDQSRARVRGVALQRPGVEEELRGGLVIDAMGRNSRVPRWLAENGFPVVPETKVGIDLGYATGRFRVPERLRPHHPMLYIVGPPPQWTRVGVRLVVENGDVFGAMGGYHGDHPPADLKGFLEFARSLSQPEVFEVLAQSELIAPIERFRIPSAIRRHYARMTRFPGGVLPIGDSICHFDPAFGQGMTVAAIEAEALASLDFARGSEDAIRREYFRKIEDVIETAWELSSGENFKYPQTAGRRPAGFSLIRRYKDRLATCGDPDVVRDLYRVFALTAPPQILLRPRVIARALGLRLAA